MKNLSNKKEFLRAKRDLYFSTAGGFIAGGSLLSYQILIRDNWNVFFAAIVSVLVAFVIYWICINQIKKRLGIK